MRRDNSANWYWASVLQIDIQVLSNQKVLMTIRLVDTKTQKTILAHEYKRRFMLEGSVSAGVANQMPDQLLEYAGAGK